MTRPEFHLRPVGGHDLDAVFGLFSQVQSTHANAHPELFRPPQKDEAFERYFEGILGDPDQHLVFACADGTEAGCIHFFLGVCPADVFRPERRIAYIRSVVVAEKHRRTGCASFLIDHVKQEARSHGAAHLGIDTWSFNHAARACFEKAGFTVRKESMWQRL